MDKDLTRLNGKHLWIWEADSCGGAAGIIATAKEIGATGVVIKCADGATIWPQFAQVAPAIKAAGLVLGAWAYVYPADPQGQAAALVDAVAQGAEFLIVDAEIEFEAAHMDTCAEALGDAVRALLPYTIIGYSTFSEPRVHRAFPYPAFSTWCDFAAPQVYWGDAGMAPHAMLDNCLADFAAFGKRVFPVGQAYPQVTAAEIAMFSAHCVERWLQGVSWWSLQHMTTEIKDAVRKSEVYVPHVKPPKPVVNPIAHGLDPKQAATVAQIEKLAGELKAE